MNMAMRILLIVLTTSAYLGGLIASSSADPAKLRPVDESLFDHSRRQQPTSDVTDTVKSRDKARESGFAPKEFNRRSFWAQELGMAGVSEYSLPLLGIAERMQEVQQMLGRGQCGTPTQHAQNEILRSIDLLLEQTCQCSGSPCKRSCSGSPKDKPCNGNSSCNKPSDGQKQGNKPGNSSKTGTTSQTPPEGTERVDPAHMRGMMKRLWGELPERQREQMMQMPVEEFLPEYELMIEDYFRRLSEKNTNRQSLIPNP